jgi:histidinol dehydrogenase
MESFEYRSGAVIAEDIAEAVALADEFAPEHLCLSVADPWSWVGKIHNAGGVFVGE